MFIKYLGVTSNALSNLIALLWCASLTVSLLLLGGGCSIFIRPGVSATLLRQQVLLARWPPHPPLRQRWGKFLLSKDMWMVPSLTQGSCDRFVPVLVGRVSPGGRATPMRRWPPTSHPPLLASGGNTVRVAFNIPLQCICLLGKVVTPWAKCV